MPKKGKKGVDQRVKGNVKAASSGRMADLLGGELTAGFIGFEAVSRGMGREEEGEEGEEGGVEEVSHGTGAQFQVVMKQLGKRDTTTKLKALQEFSGLCEREPAEAVVAVLNVWALMYNKLSTDNDNRVREASHKALQSCVKKIKNSLGPHLRSILGSWVAGMCDPYGSAASAAQTAFSTAFTPAKQTDALKFGFKSIIAFVEDVTLKQTQDTFSDPKVVPADERLQRYERVVTMAVYGLSLTFQRLPAQLIADRQEDWETFLTEKRLWKLARHQNPYIRAASYTMVVTLCKHCGAFVSSHARLFCGVVLGSLGEKEPVVVGPLWEAALLVVDINHNWNEHVNVQKAMLPGLWQLLNGGGHGSARLTYPRLVPLLHTLVQQVYLSDVDFAVSFLERLKSGVEADRVRGSVTESEAVMETFGQALLYLFLTINTRSRGETERQHFYESLLNMVVELVEYSVGQCPRTQANVVCGWIGRILDNLLETGSSHPWIEQYLQRWLQPQLTERISALLEKNSDKAHFVRMESLLQSLSTHYTKPTAGRRVTFAAKAEKTTTTPENTSGDIQCESDTPHEEGESIRTQDSERSEVVDERSLVPEEARDERQRGEHAKKTEELLTTRKSFLRPAIACLCAHCIVTIVKKRSIEHCTLLCVALRLYGEGETVVSVGGDNHVRILRKSLRTGHIEGMVAEGQEGGEGEERGGEGEGGKPSVTEVVLQLSDCLLGAIDETVISGCDPQLTEGVVSSILLLLEIEGVATEAVTDFLDQLVQEHPSTLLLLLTKLGGQGEGKGRVEWVKFLLHTHQSLLLKLVSGDGGGTVRDETFLWKFLDISLTSPGCFESEDGIQMKRDVFGTLSSALQSSLQKGGSVGSTATQRQLQTLARATPDVVEDYFTFKAGDGCGLLRCMLNWSLDNCRTTSFLLTEVYSCYSHLATLLPEPVSYLESTANLLTSLVHSQLDRMFEIAVTVHLLHYPVLNSYGTFWSLYQLLRPRSPAGKGGFLSLGALESFCFNQPYSPFFDDLSYDGVVTTLSDSQLTVLFLATALCNTTTLCKTLESLGLYPGLAALELRGKSSESSSNLSVAFPVKDSPQEEKNYFRLWRMTVSEMILALCALQPSQFMQQSSVEKSVVNVLRCSLEECLTVGSGDHHQWNGRLLDELIDRASMEGPLWCQVLYQFITALESSLDDDDRATVLPDFISVVLHDPQPGLVLAAGSGLSPQGRTQVEGQMMGSVRGRESDICLLCVYLHLLPQSQADLLSLASRGLSSVAAQHGSSELTLFESLDESIQDPLVFSLLEVMSLLATANMVPTDAWEFILCGLVTIVQLILEATADHRSSVNYTVFYCKAMQACRDVAVFLASPLSPEQQSEEWEEFFSPDIQARLLPVFLNSATQTTSDQLSHCQKLQHFFMARTVSEVCTTGLDDVSLETLIDILFYPFYPFKVTAFLLAKRLVSTAQFIVEDDTSASHEKTTVITVPELRTLLSAALERVNLDLVFGADPTEDAGNGGHTHTASYLLLWLILIEIMSHCGPEARASLGEWLKEQSLFSHLLHGLFNILSETGSPLKTQIEVTLQPDLETLSTVLYTSVARLLPSMLRQWYLAVDRWTSATVTEFTTKYVSPALQQTELEAIGKTTTTHGNMEVRAYVGVSEVSVVYRLHEFSIELFVHLPSNYPLQPPSIREGKRARVEASQWRKWMLQLNVFVANQNGTLMDGLLLWKSNLDKHFAGVEDCMICFSVIHGSLYSLPKMTCRTCKKKFHSACLYKWFNTSNKSSCPLCRNIF